METIKWHTDIFIISVNLLSGNKYKLVLRISLQNNKSTEWIQLAVSVDCTSRIQFFFAFLCLRITIKLKQNYWMDTSMSLVDHLQEESDLRWKWSSVRSANSVHIIMMKKSQKICRHCLPIKWLTTLTSATRKLNQCIEDMMTPLSTCCIITMLSSDWYVLVYFSFFTEWKLFRSLTKSYHTL